MPDSPDPFEPIKREVWVWQETPKRQRFKFITEELSIVPSAEGFELKQVLLVH